MKKFLMITALITLLICAFVFVGCSSLTASDSANVNSVSVNGTSSNGGTSDAGTGSSSDGGSDDGASTSVTTLSVDPAEDATEVFVGVEETESDFAIVTEDGSYSQEGSVYTLTAAGSYTLSGYLNGQILVDAEDAEVEIVLNGVTIVYGSDSPIKVVAADEVEISAKNGSENLIKDTRSEKTEDLDTQGEGAISAKCDLKLKGKGVLVVEAGYNNGVHTTKDLTIKNLSLKVTAVNNAIKGKCSVTMESGTVVAISTKGDGVETDKTDLSSKGKQRGTVTLEDGTLTIYAAGDGIQASYNAEIKGGTLTIYTGSYSSYTASSATTTSYKGIKAGNELLVSGGTLQIYSYDDGLHADYGTALDNGETSVGNITISGGEITIGVYSPTKSTAGGMKVRGGFGGWSGQQEVKGSDAIHADNTLTITGGTVKVDSAYEGLEATHIKIEGGNITVFATDDGVNAAKKIAETPTIVVSGGYLDITVPTSGDTDGIDSNGSFTQTGGVVILRGPGSASGRMGGGAWALDAEGAISVSGGTLIVFGGIEGNVSSSGMIKVVCSSSTVSAGTHSVTVGSEKYTVELKYATNGCVVYSTSNTVTLK